MCTAFLFTKLFRAKNPSAIVYSAANPAIFHHNSFHFLRHISSNTSSAQSPSQVSSLRRMKKELNRDCTVSYLVESCGLSPKDALSASENVHFTTPERSDWVLDLLRRHGFTSTQITTLVRKYPPLLSADAEKMISPKLEFFQSMGVSTDDLTQIFSYSPYLWSKSLPNHIEPVCRLIKSLVQSDKNASTAIKRSSLMFSCDHKKSLMPNVSLLQKLGVSAPSISLVVTHFPQVLLINHEQFSAGVSKVKEMGFDPSKSTFVLAVRVLSGKGSKLIWDRCYKIYSTKWGWSEEDILSAFMKHPHCMTLSEKNLNLSMEFLLNTMGWSSKCVAQQPIVLLYSLEKRIIPRCSVIRVLWRKGLLSKDLSPGPILQPVEKVFLERYVTKYKKEIPQLLSVYKGESDALDL